MTLSHGRTTRFILILQPELVSGCTTLDVRPCEHMLLCACFKFQRGSRNPPFCKIALKSSLRGVNERNVLPPTHTHALISPPSAPPVWVSTCSRRPQLLPDDAELQTVRRLVIGVVASHGRVEMSAVISGGNEASGKPSCPSAPPPAGGLWGL